MRNSLKERALGLAALCLAAGLALAGCDYTANPALGAGAQTQTTAPAQAQAAETVPPTTAIATDTATPAATETPAPPPPTGTPTTEIQPSETPTELAATDTPLPIDTPAPTFTPRPAKKTATPHARPSATPEAVSGGSVTATPQDSGGSIVTVTPGQAEAAPTVEAPSAGTPNQFLDKTVDGKHYDVYIDTATKLHQYFHFTCEFDAAWVVLKTFGIDTTLDDQVGIIGLDTSVEPTWEETDKGIFIYGGDILHHYSGNYQENFLARSSGSAMSKVFEHYGLTVNAVHTQAALKAALQRGQLVWIKTTADFKPGKPATWIMPDGTTYQTVLGNDHAAVVMGYSDRGPLIRDVLGPTSTNLHRTYEYEVTWETFMAAWASQSYDGLGVGR